MLAQVFTATAIKKNGPARRPAIAPVRRVAFLFNACWVVLAGTAQSYCDSNASSIDVESVVGEESREERPEGSTLAIQIGIWFGSLESETAPGGDGDDRSSQHDYPGHDHQHFELWQSDHGHQAGGVHDGVVHGMEQSGDQYAGAGAVVEPASDQSAAQMREQEDAVVAHDGVST